MENLIAIYNFKQACAYIKNGLQPVHLEYGKKGDLIFYFDKESTKELWELWKEHKLSI